MNKKILFSTFLSLAVFGCISTIGKEAVRCNAIDPDHMSDSAINVKKIETFSIRDGVKYPDTLRTFKNNAAGYRLEVIEDEYNEDTKGFDKYRFYTYTYDEKNNLLSRIRKSYDEGKDDYVDTREDLYEYYENNSLKKHTQNNINKSTGEKTKFEEQEYEYNTDGLVKTLFNYSASEGKQKTDYTYDENKNLLSTKKYNVNQSQYVLSTQFVYYYNENNDCIKEEYTSYQSDGQAIAICTDIDYTYSEPHKLKEQLETRYKAYDSTRTDVWSYEKDEYTYNGIERTDIFSTRTPDEENFTIERKIITYDAKECEYRYSFSKNGDSWDYLGGEKTDYTYSGDQYLGYTQYDSETEGVWDAYLQEVVTYNPVGAKGLPVGAIIGIAVGSVAVIYVAGFILWKKSVLKFLTKPAFGKVYGWLDKIVFKSKKK